MNTSSRCTRCGSKHHTNCFDPDYNNSPIKKDFISSKSRLKALRTPIITDAGLFWIIYFLLIIGGILVWLTPWPSWNMLFGGVW